MNDKKYRIVKITHGDNEQEFIVEKRTWYGKWKNCLTDQYGLPDSFFTLEDAEKAYSRHIVAPVAEVVKEFD